MRKPVCGFCHVFTDFFLFSAIKFSSVVYSAARVRLFPTPWTLRAICERDFSQINLIQIFVLQSFAEVEFGLSAAPQATRIDGR